ncbi:MAG TPA: SDR family oxidoreductase [Micromonosporaceae bacterium]|nr:SDR family oxidoreductase [Micromonosporaceae bacterium]
MELASLAVTGATGRVGGRVARRLAAAGVPQRLVVRDPARAPALPGAAVVRAEYGDAPADRAAARSALAGVETLFMVSGGESVDRVDRHRAFIDAAAEAGVRRLVYLSFFGAAPDATFTLARDHWATEEHLRASGVPHTVVRDNLYADFLPMIVGEDGVIRGPAGDGRAAMVAQDDIADAVVAVLRDPAPHEGRRYDLTGPAALTLHEAAALLTAATGREVRYHPETVEEAYASRAHYGAPAWEVDAWVSTYTAIAAGELAGVSADVERLTGRPATPVPEVLARTAAGTS